MEYTDVYLTDNEMLEITQDELRFRTWVLASLVRSEANQKTFGDMLQDMKADIKVHNASISHLQQGLANHVVNCPIVERVTKIEIAFASHVSATKAVQDTLKSLSGFIKPSVLAILIWLAVLSVSHVREFTEFIGLHKAAGG